MNAQILEKILERFPKGTTGDTRYPFRIGNSSYSTELVTNFILELNEICELKLRKRDYEIAADKYIETLKTAIMDIDLPTLYLVNGTTLTRETIYEIFRNALSTPTNQLSISASKTI